MNSRKVTGLLHDSSPAPPPPANDSHSGVFTLLSRDRARSVSPGGTVLGIRFPKSRRDTTPSKSAWESAAPAPLPPDYPPPAAAATRPATPWAHGDLQLRSTSPPRGRRQPLSSRYASTGRCGAVLGTLRGPAG